MVQNPHLNNVKTETTFWEWLTGNKVLLNVKEEGHLWQAAVYFFFFQTFNVIV